MSPVVETSVQVSFHNTQQTLLSAFSDGVPTLQAEGQDASVSCLVVSILWPHEL